MLVRIPGIGNGTGTEGSRYGYDRSPFPESLWSPGATEVQQSEAAGMQGYEPTGGYGDPPLHCNTRINRELCGTPEHGMNLASSILLYQSTVAVHVR